LHRHFLKVKLSRLIWLNSLQNPIITHDNRAKQTFLTRDNSLGYQL